MLAAVNLVDYCHTAPSYQAEARARIIFFDMGRASEAEADLQRTASLGHELPRTMSKEHSGLLRWPESFRRSRGGHNASLSEIRNQPDSFSARALQLSMYGSMVSPSGQGAQGHRRHRPRGMPNKRHSSSYPRVPSRPANTRPLLSVQSEGSNMKREATTTAPAPATSTDQQQQKVMQDDNSSDDSAGEEVIVRVDSPSMLSFRQSAAGVRSPPPSQDQ
jgi:hypothetical protein